MYGKPIEIAINKCNIMIIKILINYGVNMKFYDPECPQLFKMYVNIITTNNYDFLRFLSECGLNIHGNNSIIVNIAINLRNYNFAKRLLTDFSCDKHISFILDKLTES
jgi:hypothetical protein